MRITYNQRLLVSLYLDMVETLNRRSYYTTFKNNRLLKLDNLHFITIYKTDNTKLKHVF